MNRRFLFAVLAASSMLGGPAYAQSSDIRQAEQDREAQRQRELRERPQYLPGDRERMEAVQRQHDAQQRRQEAQREYEAQRQHDAAQRQREAQRQHEAQRQYEASRQYRGEPRYRDARPGWRDGYDDRGDRGRGHYRDYRSDEWRHSGRGAGPSRSWYRGGHLPREYRSRDYVVDDWRAHRLYAPPRGHQWVQAGGDYVLVAVATGVIAAILMSQ